MTAVTTPPVSADRFEISRVFDAPVERVWQAWTDMDDLGRWFVPKGAAVTMLHFDLRPGGYLHSRVDAPDAPPMWSKFVYRAVEHPVCLVWAHSFADAHANVIRAPFSPSWPLELLTTLTFAGGTQTSLTLSWAPLDATDAERETFAAAIPAMAGGWGGSFDQLTDYLRSA